MHNRFWFYLASIITIAALGGVYLMNKRQLDNELQQLTSVAVEADHQQLAAYLDRQTDAFKLVGLAKLYAKNRPDLVRPVVERAYALNPNSRDIAILASPYLPAAKERVKFLDPLFENGSAD